MPAFTAGGDISLGANKLKTSNLVLKEGSSTVWHLRNAADDDYRDIYCRMYYLRTGLEALVNSSQINTYNADGGYIIGQARDTGVGLAEIFRMVGANWAHLLLTRARFGTTALTADADHRGGLYVEEGGVGVADRLFIIMKNSLDGYEAVQIATAS
jgi:hypothetical protein